MLKKTAALLALLLTSACQPHIPENALMLKPESLALRQLQTRKFDTKDEKTLLKASAAVAQDLGFTLDESQTKLGLIVASKDRDAMEAGQVAGAVVIAAVFGVAAPIDDHQKIRVSIVTAPAGKETNLRATFQRIVWNTDNEARNESIEDPEIYQLFFEKLSKGVFLTANEI